MTLLELGRGFAFVGRQHRFEIAGDEFFFDLLLFNWLHNRFLVIELKVGRSAPILLCRWCKLSATLSWQRGGVT